MSGHPSAPSLGRRALNVRLAGDSLAAAVEATFRISPCCFFFGLVTHGCFFDPAKGRVSPFTLEQEQTKEASRGELLRGQLLRLGGLSLGLPGGCGVPGTGGLHPCRGGAGAGGPGQRVGAICPFGSLSSSPPLSSPLLSLLSLPGFLPLLPRFLPRFAQVSEEELRRDLWAAVARLPLPETLRAFAEAWTAGAATGGAFPAADFYRAEATLQQRVTALWRLLQLPAFEARGWGESEKRKTKRKSEEGQLDLSEVQGTDAIPSCSFDWSEGDSTRTWLTLQTWWFWFPLEISRRTVP